MLPWNRIVEREGHDVVDAPAVTDENPGHRMTRRDDPIEAIPSPRHEVGLNQARQ